MSASMWPIESSCGPLKAPRNLGGKISDCEIRWANQGLTPMKFSKGDRTKRREGRLCRHTEVHARVPRSARQLALELGVHT